MSERFKEPVLKTGVRLDETATQTKSDKALNEMTANDALSVLAHRLALLVQESPDLALVIDAWPTLPEAVKTGIMALVSIATSDAV